MTRTLTARQTELTQRNTRRPIPFVVLTTYTNRQSKTVDTVFYFSDRAALYDYANAGTTRQFWPFLMQIGDLASSMTHLPSPSLPTIESVSVKLQNIEISPGGLWLSEHLRTKNVEFATVEIAELDLDREPDYCDFTSLVGDEHVVLYRGELVNVGDVTDAEMTLTFETIVPRIPWGVLSDATTNDLRDLGKRKNIVYGADPRVPLHATTAAARTTLAQAITSATTGNVNFTDTTGFSNGTISIGGELMTFTVTSSTQLNITARAQSGTAAAEHLAGMRVYEVLSSAKWTASQHIVDAISAVYTLNPYTGDLFRLTSATHYTGNVNDGGEATVAISNTQITALMSAAAQSAIVTNQPDVTEAIVAAGIIPTTVTGVPSGGGTPTFDPALMKDSDLSTYGHTGVGGTNYFEIVFTDPSDVITITGQYLNVYVHSGTASSFDVTCGGVTVQAVTGGAPGLWTFWTTQTSATWRLTNSFAADCRMSEVTRDLHYTRLAAVTDVAVEAAEIGYALDLYADLRGYEAAGADYSVAAGVMLAHPSDILRHLIAAVCGEGMTAVEDSSFDTSVTNLGSAAFACTLDSLAGTDAGILARIAFEARSNLIPIQTATAQQWRLVQALTTYAFPAATLPTITEGEWTEHGIDADQISTRFRAIYDRDPSLGDDIDAYRGLVRIDSTQNDVTVPSTAQLTAAEASFGRRELDALSLLCISDLVTAEDLLGYIAKEAIRAPRTYVGRELPWWDAYQIELGDIVNVVVTWRAATIKCRVVQYVKSFDSQLVTLGVVEVA